MGPDRTGAQPEVGNILDFFFGQDRDYYKDPIIHKAADEGNREFDDATPLHMATFAAELARQAPDDVVVFDEALTVSPEVTRYLVPDRPPEEFDALKADAGSIKFGPTGTEASGHCNKHKADLLCHFDMEAANFEESHTEGKVTGTIGGLPFEGTGWLKVIPVKRED